jgi:hypothetical protein
MENLYIIHSDKSKFTGNVINTMPFLDLDTEEGKNLLNSTFVHYREQTFADYNKEHNNELIALNWDQFEREYYRPHLNSMQGKFKKTTKAQFWDGLECLPPLRWTRAGSNEFFFVGECYTANLYTCYVRKGEEYYTALRSINTKAEDLFNLLPVSK